MPLEFDPPLDDAPTINVCLIGPPKSGKTGGAASAPGPVLYLSADLKNRMRFARRRYGDKLKVVTVKGRQTLVDATYAALEGEFATVVVDPMSDLYRILLEERLGGKVPETMNNHVLSQYRVVQDTIESFCRAMCKASVNFVIVCHDLESVDGVTGEKEYLPSTGASKPKLGRTLMGMVDIVGFTGRIVTDDGPEYVAQLVPAKGRPGGDGFNCLADERGLRKLDLSEWIEAIKAAEAAPITEES